MVAATARSLNVFVCLTHCAVEPPTPLTVPELFRILNAPVTPGQDGPPQPPRTGEGRYTHLTRDENQPQLAFNHSVTPAPAKTDEQSASKAVAKDNPNVELWHFKDDLT